MTAPPEFGAAIEVGGVRPGWLPDDVEFRVWNAKRSTPGHGTAAEGYDWEDIQDIVLEVPRYDFVYLALERGMVPYFGQGKPDDWDQSKPVLYRDSLLGRTVLTTNFWDWTRSSRDPACDIIGYHATSTALPLAHPAAPRGEESENNLPACNNCGAPAGLDCRTGQGRIPPCHGRELLADTTNQTMKWRERWYGSEPQKGSAIVDERGNLIAYFGGDKTTHKATTAVVSAHNAALAALAPAAIASGREGAE